MKIKHANLVLADGIIQTGLLIEDGLIKSIDKQTEGLDLSGYYVVPGFIDQHIHGSANADTMDGNQAALTRLAVSLLKEGTTSFLPTTMTGDPDVILQALKNVKSYPNTEGARVVGAHLEGPFINEKAIGAQPLKYVKKPSIEAFKPWFDIGVIKVITLAPEIEGAQSLIEFCRKYDIVSSIGHTKATYQQVLDATKWGVHQVTHGYNAMTPLHHRDIGVVGAMLLEKNLYAELICDGIHVSKEAVKLLYQNKGRDGIILITDSMRAKYMPEGESELGGQTVYIKDNEARLADGTLAGSILKMNDAVKNMMTFCQIPLYDAVYMASTMPAKNLNLSNKGLIKVGYDADLTVLDQDLNVVMTIVAGQIRYQKESK